MKEKEFSLSDKEIDLKGVKDVVYCGVYFRSEVKQKINDFIEELRETCEQEDFDVMLKDGEDGDITISMKEYVNGIALKHFGNKLIKEGK